MTPFFKVHRLTGDYSSRIAQASAIGVQCYLEQHLNAVVDPTVNYPLAKYVTPRSRDMAVEYAIHMQRWFSFSGKWRAWAMPRGERGRYNLNGIDCPAILAEPGFISHPEFAAWAKADKGIEAMAKSAIFAIRGVLPNGGAVGLSVGHVGKTSSPGDRGAKVYGGGWESGIAARIVERIELELLRLSLQCELVQL